MSRSTESTWQVWRSTSLGDKIALLRLFPVVLRYNLTVWLYNAAQTFMGWHDRQGRIIDRRTSSLRRRVRAEQRDKA